MSVWVPVLPSIVAASEPRAALTVEGAAQAILDTGVSTLAELHVLGTDWGSSDGRIRRHDHGKLPALVHSIRRLDLLVLDGALPPAELLEALEAARDRASDEGEAPPVVVYHGVEEDAPPEAEVLPRAALAPAEAWESVVVPGLGGLVVLVDPARIAERPRLAHLLRHFGTPIYLTQRLRTVDLKRQGAERRAAAGVPPGPAPPPAQVPNPRDAERAELAIRSAEDARRALAASQEQVLELMRQAHNAALESAGLRARLSGLGAAQAALDARAASAESERRQLDDTVRRLRARELQLFGQIRELERITVDIHQAEARRQSLVRYLEAVAASRSWRWGHGIAVIARRLTFRRSAGGSGLDRALSLAREPLVRDPAPPAT